MNRKKKTSSGEKNARRKKTATGEKPRKVLPPSDLQSSIILQTAMDGFWLADAATQKILAVNDAYCRMSGYSREELLQMTISQVEIRENSADVSEHVKRIMETGTDRFETVHRRKDGSELPLDISVQYQPKLGRTFAFMRDITERRRMDENELKLKSIFESSRDAIGVSCKGIHNLVNPAYVSMFGYASAEELIGKPIIELIAPESRALVLENVRARAAGKNAPTEYEARALRKDGATFVMNVRVSTYELNGEVHTLVILRDITERKRTEDALRENEQTLRMMLETMSEGIALNEIVYDENGEMCDYRILNVNPAFYATSNYADKRVVGNTATQLYGMDSRFIKAFWKTHKENKTVAYTEMPSPASGRWFFVATSPFVNDRFVTSFFDITDRKKAEEELRFRKEQYENFIAQSFEAISRTELDQPIDITLPVEEQIELIYKNAYMAECNQAMAKMYEVPTPEAFVGMRLIEAHGGKDHPVNRAAFRKFIENGYKSINDETQEYTAGGKPVWFLSNTVGTVENGKLIRLWGTAIDITERKRAEEEIRVLNESLERRVEERTRELMETQEKLTRQEKLAALGQMAGSVGHELRNPLGVISNAVYFLKIAQSDASAKVKEYLDLIEKHVQISDKIVTDLLDFTRIKSLERQPICVAEIARQALTRFPPPKSVQTRLDLPEDLPKAYADPMHVTQVLGNLMLNACQAMEAKGGELFISCRPQNNELEIVIHDTGPGIAPEHIHKIFEPLFTTKAQGIGLGLAVSKKLIEANGGRIEAESKLGEGSAFKVYLPVYGAES